MEASIAAASSNGFERSTEPRALNRPRQSPPRESRHPPRARLARFVDLVGATSTIFCGGVMLPPGRMGGGCGGGAGGGGVASIAIKLESANPITLLSFVKRSSIGSMAGSPQYRWGHRAARRQVVVYPVHTCAGTRWGSRRFARHRDHVNEFRCRSWRGQLVGREERRNHRRAHRDGVNSMESVIVQVRIKPPSRRPRRRGLLEDWTPTASVVPLLANTT